MLIENMEQTKSFMKSLGFPNLRIHHAINHFDFIKTDRRILVIGPMGSGKSEFSARIYRDSQVTMQKSEKVQNLHQVKKSTAAMCSISDLKSTTRDSLSIRPIPSPTGAVT